MKTKYKKFIILFIALVLTAGIADSSVYPLSLKADAKAKKEYKVKNGMLLSYEGSSEVYIRDNVSAIATYAFDDDNVTSFTVSSNNKYLKSVDGVLYTKDGKRLVRYPSGRKGSFTVPGTVTYIAQYAFKGCKKLTNASIPASVKGIGSNAFYECRNLESVDIPSHIDKISEYTFYRCRSLKNIILPNGIESIGKAAFYGCTGLTEINLPSSVKKIKSMAFAKCTSLKSISIPEDVSNISRHLFNKCTNLVSINLNNNIEKIASEAFSYCKSLKEISIPDSTDTIEAYAFRGCESLEKIKLPDGIEEVNYGTFKGCTSLKKVRLPESIKYIYQEAFKNCVSLETVNIPEQTELIKGSAFANAAASFNVDSENGYFSAKDGVLYNKMQTVLLKYPCYKPGDYTTPDGLKKISAYAFKECKKIGKARISEGIKKFPKNCLANSSITHLSLPESLREINNTQSKVYTDNLKAVAIPDTNRKFCSVDGLLYSKDKKNLYIYPNGKTGVISFTKEAEDLSAIEYSNKASGFKIPTASKSFSTDDGIVTNLKRSKILFVPAEKISYTMGKNMKNITEINNAKQYMHNFKSYKVTSDNSKYKASDGILYSFDMEKLIDCPSAKTGSYTIPSSVTSVSDSAFNYSRNLKSITITKNVIKCSLMLFDCTSLKDIVVKEGSLREFMLNVRNNTRLESVTLPSSLVSCNIYGQKAGYSSIVINGWTNTESEKLAARLRVKFNSMGLVPNQVKGVKAKAYVHGKRVRITWKKDEQASGYEIYTDNEKLKNIKDNQITKADIYVGSNSYNVIYIRAYKIQNGKKIYGKAKKIVYTNY